MHSLADGRKVAPMEPRTHHISLSHRSWAPGEAKLITVPSLKAIHYLRGYALLALVLIITCLYLLYGQERAHEAPVVRNTAWNDLIKQIGPRADSPSNESLGRDLVLIQNFLKKHEFEEKVGIYDPAVLRAIDQARARLQKADKDLQMIRSELSYREYAGKWGR